jgi:hypothetical protein
MVVYDSKPPDVFVHYSHIELPTLQAVYHLSRCGSAMQRLFVVVLVKNHWLLKCSFRTPEI